MQRPMAMMGMARSGRFQQYSRDAIAAAKSAAGFYGVLAESTRDRAARCFLDAQAVREKATAEASEIYALESTDRALPPFPTQAIERAQIVPEWRAVDDVSLDQAVALVLEAAHHSALLYGALADGVEGQSRELLAALSEQQDVRAQVLQRLHGAGWIRHLFTPRRVTGQGLLQRLRDAITADGIAARTHALMTLRARDRASRIFLEQLALDERRCAEALEIAVLEQLDVALPRAALDTTDLVRQVPVVDPPGGIGLSEALEHAMLFWPLRILQYREMAALARRGLSRALRNLALERQELLAQITWRRAAFAGTQALGVETAPLCDLLSPAG